LTTEEFKAVIVKQITHASEINDLLAARIKEHAAAGTVTPEDISQFRDIGYLITHLWRLAV
jgi:hypothetical protein